MVNLLVCIGRNRKRAFATLFCPRDGHSRRICPFVRAKCLAKSLDELGLVLRVNGVGEGGMGFAT